MHGSLNEGFRSERFNRRKTATGRQQSTHLIAQRQSKPAAPKAPRSSDTRRNAGAAARRSRQARHSAEAPAAGIDAASMARRCQNAI